MPPHNVALIRCQVQLLQYNESLQNLPLLLVSDIDTIIVHTKPSVRFSYA